VVEILSWHGVVSDIVPGAVLEANPGAGRGTRQLELAAANRHRCAPCAARRPPSTRTG